MKFSIFIFLLICAGATARGAGFAGALLEAQGLLHKKEFGKAEEQFRSFLSRSDTRHEATLGLSAALEGQGRQVEAVEAVSGYLAQNPLDVPMLMRLADLRLGLGQGDLARKELERVKVLRPAYDGLEERLAESAALLGRKDEAISSLEGVRQKKGLGARHLLLLAGLRADSGSLEAAENVLREFESQHTPTANSLLLKARVLMKLKRSPEAEVAFRRAIQAQEREPATWNAYAEFLQGEKRFAEARKLLENVLAIAPSAPDTHMRLGEAHELEGNYAEAAKAFAKALSLSAGDDQAMFAIVRVEEKSGSMDRVGSRLQTWLAAYPEKTWVAISYARVLMAIGHRARAAEVIKASMAVNRQSPELTAYLDQIKNEPVEIEPQPASVATSPKAAKALEGEYVVQEGELLGSISAKLYGSTRHWKKLFEENRDRMKSPEDLSPGMKLRVPKLNESLKKEKPKTTGLLRKDLLRSRVYVVRRGEILSRISTKVYGTAKEWRRIFEANRRKLRRPSSAFAGMKLKIPALPKELVDFLSPVEPAVAAEAVRADVVEEAPISFLSAAPTRKNESLLVSPDSVKLPDLGAREAPAAASEDTSPVAEVPRVDAGFRFSLSAAPIRESVDLAASGFSANLPGRVGYQAGAELGYQLEARPVSFAARFNFSRTKFDSLSGVTPSSIEVERKRLALLSRFSAGIDGLWITLGYGITRRAAAETTPRALVTNRDSGGVILGVTKDYSFSSVLRGSSGLELFLPHRQEENSALTGFQKSGFAAELRTEISRAVGASVALALGLSARLERSTFKGAGTRGTTDAQDTDMIFSIPLELRF